MINEFKELVTVRNHLIEEIDKLDDLSDMWQVGARDGLRQGVVQLDSRIKELSKEASERIKTRVKDNPKSYLHSCITKELNAIYVAKNSDYGDAFGETYKKLGIISAVTRITDKVNRLQSLAVKSEEERLVKDESIQDSARDLANYAIMMLIEMGYDPEGD